MRLVCCSYVMPILSASMSCHAGSFDARSAFKLSGGPLSGAQRLRYYMGSSSSAQGQSQVTGTDSTAEDGSCRSAQDGEGQDLEGSRASVHAPRVSSSGDFPLQSFLSTRALAFGADNSTKFSPFLAQGCLSPRQVRVRGTTGASDSPNPVMM